LNRTGDSGHEGKEDRDGAPRHGGEHNPAVSAAADKERRAAPL
jgi:hypothetical protein